MVAGDEGYGRHIAALLLAELDTDEQEVVDRALVLLRALNGDAEGLGPRTVVAGFDHPTAAVAAATRLHTSVPATPALPRWRVGLHVGKIVMTAGSAATGIAIDRATALARLARPGTTALDPAALELIGPLRDVVPETADGVQLLVPRPPGPSLGRRRLVVAVLATAAGGVGAAAWMTTRHFRREGARRKVTLGVGPFRSSRTDPEHAWIGIALRGGLNTLLSELSSVKVYSQEFLDFLMNQEGLSEIEVANRLGIEKMLSGAVLVVGESVRLEARIVDVASGLLEGAYTAVGREDDFLALEREVVLGVIAKLHVPLSAEDERRLAARRASDPYAFRRLLDVEGAGGSEAPASPGDGGGKPRPRSGLGATVAYADDASRAVSEFLEEYRRATEARDVAALGVFYQVFSPEQRAALERYFSEVYDLRMRIDNIDVAIVGEESVVSYTRTDDFVDVPTGRPHHVSLRVTRRLRREAGVWRFAGPQ